MLPRPYDGYLIHWFRLQRFSRDYAVELVERQAHGHREHGNRREPEVSSGPYAGIYAEMALAELFDYAIDQRVNPHGDGGYDIVAPFGRVDAKAIIGMNPQNVIHRKGTAMADYLVVARYLPEHDVVAFIGWARGAEMLAAPTGPLPGRTIINHILPVGRLHCMSEFDRMN